MSADPTPAPGRQARGAGAADPARLGPLAALLDRGRAVLADVLEPGEIVAGGAMRAYTVAQLATRDHGALDRPLLVVVPTEKDAEALCDDLGAYLGEHAVAHFPPWETLPHERLSPQAATVGQRLRVLDRLRRTVDGDEKDRPVRAVVAPVRALLQPMDPRLAERQPIRLDAAYGDGLDGLVESLAALGYTRTSMVERRGEFAVRGGLVDVFPTAADHPVRVEFFGDDIDELRAFSAANQRTLETVESVEVDAARELVLDAETAATATLLAGRIPALAEQLGLLAEGIAFEGMESLVTAIHPTPAFLNDFFPSGSGTAVVDVIRVADRAAELRTQAEALLVASWGDEEAAGFIGTGPSADGSGDAIGYAAWDDVLGRARGPVWQLTPFGDVDVPGMPWESFRGDIAAAAMHVRRHSLDGELVVLTTAGHGAALRLAEVLRDAGLSAPVVKEIPDADGGLRPDQDGGLRPDQDGGLRPPAPPEPSRADRDGGLRPPAPPELPRGGGGSSPVRATWSAGSTGRVVIVESSLREGFRAPHLGAVVLGEWDLFGPRRSRASRRLPSKRAAGETVLDLAPGDSVVHSVHGIGRYIGMVARELRGSTTSVGGGHTGSVTRDYVVLEYAGGDRLFVPSDQVDAIARYVGGENPKVMRLGGNDWDRAKTKVRKAVQEMAAELIRLYSARMHSQGHAHALDTAWQSELEQAFPHTETADQVSAIDEVKLDMEAPLPMDRLICGDVGFGKTEIAVRAAAKSVFDGKQVVVLVPTTLLAQQHFETFSERFSGFPVAVRQLSRFISAKQQKAIIDGLAAGTVDLVVGTHRLFAADVQFKDLGLVIIDEEQRFGVAHKERLKQLRTNVDVLTMTATPIPRTLEMAITGIRDLSTIDTPPEDRQPVVTHVGEWDERQATLAVRRELLREGQVFWVHNQVQTIDAAAERVRELVPGARVEVAHGRMDEAALERIMVRFWERDFDVLVSTTIIESGIDVPNANTLIVERADLLGLAQMYQLRGRVGRSSARGYAYLFFPEEKAMTEEAYKRLETVSMHTGLGSGLAIALRDLEIRGAGDVLSGNQSGHVASVGFESYAALMREAVEDLRAGGGGKPKAPEAEISIDLPVDAHLPKDYIADEALRLEAYRKVAAVRDGAGMKAVRAELEDRYGPLPPPAERLLGVSALRAAIRRWGITELKTTPRRTVRVSPVSLSDSQEVRLSRTHPDALYNAAAGALELPMPRKGDLVGGVARMLRDLFAPAKSGT